MKTDNVKTYLKSNYKFILFGLLVNLLLCYFVLGRDYFPMGIYLFFLIPNYYKYEDRQVRLQKLKTKGLTERDISNIDFVKKWEETRAKGLWRYCLRDGGVIAGAVFCPIFCLLAVAKNTKITDEPSAMFKLIGYCYLLGTVAGGIGYRFLWNIKQEKFRRLTDPFYKTFIRPE